MADDPALPGRALPRPASPAHIAPSEPPVPPSPRPYPLSPPAPETPVQGAGGEATAGDIPPRDPREDEGWFRCLPPAAQEDLRTRWRIDAGLERRRRERRRDTSRVYVLEGALAFLFLELLLMGASPRSLLGALLFGAAAGLLCARARTTTVLTGVFFLGAFLLFGAVAGSMHFFYYLTAGLIVLCLGLALGRIHLLQRFDGSEL